MQLEKVLEEIDQEVKEYMEIDFGDEYNAGIKDMAKMAKKIIRKYMNDGWIPVEERLPMRTLDEKINESYQNYLVFIDGVDGWDIDIAVYDFWNDKKWREAHDGYGEIENVIAWRPLPEPYRPERSKGE